MSKPLKIAFFGSSLISAYWNGAATYYRGIIKNLAKHGHEVTFYEPEIYDRQKHRDIDDPEWAKVIIYQANSERDVFDTLEQAAGADVIVKTSGVGAYDELLERAVFDVGRDDAIRIFWDVDAPATLNRVNENSDDPFAELIPRYDLVLTYGGGDPVVRAYERLGARECLPIYNALDNTTHFPVGKDPRFQADLGLLANRLPDREARIDEFFFDVARQLPDKTFLLGGNGWDGKQMPENVRYIGHVYTGDHNAFNSTVDVVLNVNRDSMAEYGFSPPTRVFEAAGAGACLVTDKWAGIELFLEPETEVLVAEDSSQVVDHLRGLTASRADEIGNAALKRMLAEHTYEHRVVEVERILKVNVNAAASI